MKLRFIVTLLALLIAAPALADNLDFSRISCQEFLSGSKDDAVLMLTWFEGYFTKKDGPPIMYGAKAADHGKDIRDYCYNHPNIDVFSAAKAVMSK